ncbi:MAG: hypothetical protein J7K33_01020 [Candidatus Marinimicrobia bacterium]|nr:hypothetical protein [Candidatus Neomarinimicrobiota bacterium]
MKTFILIFVVVGFGIYLLIDFAAAQHSNHKRIILREDLPVIKVTKVNGYIVKLPDRVVINCFESPKDINNWFIRYGAVELSQSKSDILQGDFCMRIFFSQNTSAEIVLLYCPQYWQYFKYIVFEAFNPSNTKVSCEFKIGDYFDNSSWYDNHRKFKRQISIEPGLNRFCFPIKEIGEDIEIESPRKTIHLRFPMMKRGSLFYLDNVYLYNSIDFIDAELAK